MPIQPEPISLVTVIHPICNVFIERFPKMLRWFTDKSLVDKHIVVINPDDAWVNPFNLEAWRCFWQRVEDAFNDLPWNVQYVHSTTNRWDLPGYNDVAAQITTPYWIGISPDTRILQQNWIEKYFAVLDRDAEKPMALIGPEGPSQVLTPDKVSDAQWGWIPRLLVERGLEFDHCGHIQTWCFFVDTEAFHKAGGFWEPSDGIIRGKGDVIAAEIYLSVCLRRAGYELGYRKGPNIYHYGTANSQAKLEEVSAFDALNHFPSF